MVWEKLGKIFNPLKHNLHSDYIGYAQSPQVLINDDFVVVCK